jgi:uncharacterized metal-binding protein
MEENVPQCARCPIPPAKRLCRTEDGKYPPFCPTRNKSELSRLSLEEYDAPEVREFALQASIQEGEGYADKELGYARVRPLKPRILEIIEFAERMKYRRLGLAFCFGLRDEARIVEKVFAERGFEMTSAVCKAGRIPKEVIGIEQDQKICPGKLEPMCNPILQAFIFNEEKTELNILLGLCVGHDSLFLKYAKAPCTVLAVKDRLLGHNPLAAIYTIDTYFRSLKS